MRLVRHGACRLRRSGHRPPDERPRGRRRGGALTAPRQPTTERTISAMRFSVSASTVSKYHAAGIRSPSTPPADWKSTFSVSARFTRSSLRNVTSAGDVAQRRTRSEEHTSELQSRFDLVCRLLLEKKKINSSTQKRH